jgi:Protein of unknown function (DUF4231)
MSATDSAFQARKETILAECQSSIEWYRKRKTVPRILYQGSQMSIIVLGALTPVLILVTDLPKWAQALPAAVASMAAGLSSVFHWQENWVRRASTLEALRAELLKYKTRTSSAYSSNLDEQSALDNFVTSVLNLTLNELASWRDLQTKTKPDGNREQ